MILRIMSEMRAGYIWSFLFFAEFAYFYSGCHRTRYESLALVIQGRLSHQSWFRRLQTRPSQLLKGAYMLRRHKSRCLQEVFTLLAAARSKTVPAKLTTTRAMIGGSILSFALIALWPRLR